MKGLNGKEKKEQKKKKEQKNLGKKIIYHKLELKDKLKRNQECPKNKK